MMHPRTASSCLLPLLSLIAWVAWLSGCSDATTPQGGIDEVRVVANGSGEANAEPLWPLRPGWMHTARPGHTPTSWALEARRVGAGTIVPVGNAVRVGPNLITAPSEPACLRYLSQDAEGLWFHGGPAEGLLPGGALLVPATVRVGMRWQSRVDGKLRFSGQVLSRSEEATAFGPRPVWRLRLVDERALTYGAAGSGNTARKAGVPWELRLVEGRGPDGADHLTSCRDWLDPALAGRGIRAPDHGVTVVPLDDDSVDAPADVPTVKLTQMAKTPIAEGFLPFEAGSYPDPDTPGARIVAMRGRKMVFGQYMIGNARAGFSAGGGWSDAVEMRCARWSGTTIAPLGTEVPCTTPDAVVATSSGDVQALPVLWDGNPVRYNVCMGDCGMQVYHEFIGIWAGLDGLPRALAWGGGNVLHTGRYQQGTVILNTYGFVDNVFSVFHGYGQLFGPSRTSQLVWARPEQGGDVSVAEYSNDHRLPQGRTAFTRLRADGSVARRHLAAPAIEMASTVVEASGRSHYVLGFDGLLRRVHVERDGVTFEPIARLAAPAGEFLVAAFVDGGEIVALSQRGFLGVSPWFQPDGYEPTRHPVLGDVVAWRGKLPAAAAGKAVSPVFGLEVQVVDQDVRLCWPPTEAPLDAASFTFAGAPPAAVLPFRNCALLVRPAASVAALLADGAWAIEGKIPGAGRVAIAAGWTLWQEGQHFDLFESKPGGGAPLAGGGFVAPTTRWGPGLTAPAWRDGVDDVGRVAADLSGKGLWLYRPRWMEHSVSLFSDAGEQRVDLQPFIGPRGAVSGSLCVGNTCGYDIAPVAALGGGLLIGNIRVGVDGKVSLLDEPWSDGDGHFFYPTAAWADGGYCALRPSGEEVCVSATGEVAKVSAPDALVLPTSPLKVRMMTANATWRFASDDKGAVVLRRRGRKDMVAKDFPVPVNVDELVKDSKGYQATTVTYDAAGKLYVLFNNGAGHWLWRIDDDGPVPLEVPELGLYLPGQTLGLLVDAELFVFVSAHSYAEYELQDMNLQEQQRVLRVVRAGR